MLPTGPASAQQPPLDGQLLHRYESLYPHIGYLLNLVPPLKKIHFQNFIDQKKYISKLSIFFDGKFRLTYT